MQYISIDELKRIELEILKAFAQYCEKNDLRYFLYAGTLLGAVRHKGFIPWDDDIDVVMPRRDYERFLLLSQEEKIASNLDIETYRISKSSICPFIKVEDNRTDGHEENLPDTFHTGVWIDVFPLDGLPNKIAGQKKHIRQLSRLVKQLDLCTRKYIPCREPLHHLKRYIIKKLYSKIDYHEVDCKIEALAMKYDYETCEYIGNTCFAGGMNEVISKQGFEPAVELEFEGLKFKAPGNYHDYLTRLYGDYMKLPPEKDRVRKHDYQCWWKHGKQSEGQEI